MNKQKQTAKVVNSMTDVAGMMNSVICIRPSSYLFGDSAF